MPRRIASPFAAQHVTSRSQAPAALTAIVEHEATDGSQITVYGASDIVDNKVGSHHAAVEEEVLIAVVVGGSSLSSRELLQENQTAGRDLRRWC